MTIALLNTAYFPPIQYLSKIKHYETIYIEQFENYGKQSYRNRCEILTANGVMPLTVPVKKAASDKFLTKNALIDYSTNWQKLHFKGIESAYKNSPFYDYYIEDFIEYFEHQEKYLLDLNTRILESLLNLLNLKRTISFTEDYIKETHELQDFRNIIHPKSARREGEDTEFTAKPYQQTFCDRLPFVPNLSIIDLLFNAGPETTEYL